MRLHPKSRKGVQNAVALTFNILVTLKTRATVDSGMGKRFVEIDTTPSQVLIPGRYQPMRSRELHDDTDILRDYLRGWLFCAHDTKFPELGVAYIYEMDGLTLIGEYEIQQSTVVDASDRFEAKALVTQRQSS